MKCTNKEQETAECEKRGCNGCAYNEKTEERKIIEVYVTENKKEDTVSFKFEKCEESELANNTLKGLCMIFATWKDKEDELEVEFEGKDKYYGR